MTTQTDRFSDFTPKDDGFREIGDTDLTGEDVSPETLGDEEVDSKKQAGVGSIRVILCQVDAVIDNALGLPVVDCDNLADVGYSIKTIEGPFCMRVANVVILREFIRRSAMFGVKIAAFDEVPGVQRDRMFEQSVWNLPRIMYKQLLDTVSEYNEAAQAEARRDKASARTSKSFYRKDNPVKFKEFDRVDPLTDDDEVLEGEED